MESLTTESNNNADGGFFLANCREHLCSALDRLRCTVVGFVGKLAKIARDDPRRVAHSLKVGLALTLVSVLYYVTPLFNGWGDSVIWAVITVVVVMEFTVGATLSRGLNRTFATLVAVFLAVGAHMAANLCGENGEPILLSVFVFLVGSAATFSRFIPELKARYDYGVMIFILTFAMVAVSSYRVDELLEFAHERVTTIAVGVAICLFTTLFIFPIWAGEDLHKLAAGNLDKLAEFLEGMESECSRENSPCENLEGKAFLQVYNAVLNSKVREDSLCTFAKWEPIHGKFRFRHPWSQYQKLGALCRQCASSMEALASCVVVLKKSQYPEANPELCLKIRATCGAMSLHSAKALRGLSLAVRTMTLPCQTNDMSTATKAASDFRTQLSEDAALLQVMHAAVVASLLSDVVIQIERITESTSKLAQLARFTNPERTRSAVVIHIED
ncbi:aluminum-activated malate transporter 1-like [Miscanthus floridulus]|uniref:aluminum-activated malate transporter 1-like n=1 Tax=Miscanthus floridulus TaxID=154761 RepID=UPI00345776AC